MSDRRDFPHRRSRSRSRDRYQDRRNRYHRSRSRSPRDKTHHPPLGLPVVGTIHRARVVSIKPFGIFVELRNHTNNAPSRPLQAFVHNSQIADDMRFTRDDDDEIKMKAMEFFCPKGEEFYVKITEIRPDERTGVMKIAGSMKMVDQSSGQDRSAGPVQTFDHATDRLRKSQYDQDHDKDNTNYNSKPILYSIHQATIRSIRPFGVFVELDGFHHRCQALVHSSQISNFPLFNPTDSDRDKIEAISDVVGTQGDRVWVKIVDLVTANRADGPSGNDVLKIGASIKLVSQRDGIDLDPENVKYSSKSRGGHGGMGGPGGHGPIGAGAGEAHTNERGDIVIDWGHLKADVTSYGGKKYDMITAGGDGDEDDGEEGNEGYHHHRHHHRQGSNIQKSENDDHREMNVGTTKSLPPRGRGRGLVIPAWMTQDIEREAPGGRATHRHEQLSVDEPREIQSVEEALAILEEYGVKHRHRHRSEGKKHKKHKEYKKGKKEKKKSKKRKESKASRHTRSPSTSGTSSSRSSDDHSTGIRRR